MGRVRITGILPGLQVCHSIIILLVCVCVSVGGYGEG
jgi:hypothetical protein